MDKFDRERCIDRVNSIKCWDYADLCCMICPLNNTNYCNIRIRDMSDEELLGMISLWNNSFPDRQV